MQLLKEIFRTPGISTSGAILKRRAVRAIVRQDGRLLLVHSLKVGDYKFPGGGVDEGESEEQALRRELREECGARLAGVEGEFGEVIEYDLPSEPEYDAFCMTSRYYLCRVEPGLGSLHLDPYERELGFRPAWVETGAALHNNTRLLHSDRAGLPRWLEREIYVLGLLHRLPPE
jgi:8-oxo-dGTP pyrophosphatase MutT (NUDIX family)